MMQSHTWTQRGKTSLIVLAAVAVLAVMVLQPEVLASRAQPSAQRNEAIARRFFDEVFNQGKLQVVDEIFARDYVGISSANFGRPIEGPEGIKKFVTMYRTAFPDIHFTFEDIVARGDKVVVRWTTTGTHRGKLLGLAPTGKQMKIIGIGIAHLRQGRIGGSFSQVDMLSLFQQLGAVPPVEQFQ